MSYWGVERGGIQRVKLESKELNFVFFFFFFFFRNMNGSYSQSGSPVEEGDSGVDNSKLCCDPSMKWGRLEQRR